MTQFNFNEKFRQRTQALSLEIIAWYARLQPKPEEVSFLGEQLIRSATATAAHFRSACRSRSREERSTKLALVIKESDETVFWLELFQKSGLVDEQLLTPLYEEAMEILKVMATYRKNLNVEL